MTWPHTVPDEAAVKANEAKEPEGERIRRELIDFLTRNKVAGIMLDTPLHMVEVRSATLPPKIKNVLSSWGSIYVVDDSPDVPSTWTEPARPDGWNDNVVPPMTHPLCSHWKQPDLAAVTIDATTARMSKETFDALYEYSSTNPTGAYEGKMWKARVGKSWDLRWYGYSKIGPSSVSNNRRLIVLTDAEVAQ